MSTRSGLFTGIHVYISAPRCKVRIAQKLAIWLAANEAVIVSSWHVPRTVPAGSLVSILKTSRRELAEADRVLAYTASGNPSVTLCEVGEATRLGTPVWWIQGPFGRGSNIYDQHPRVLILRRSFWTSPWDPFGGLAKLQFDISRKVTT